MAGNQLQGSVPEGWPELLSLDLSSNNFTVAHLDNMSDSLWLLYLNNNSLAGTAPPSGFPTNLTLLDLSFNFLSGSLPSNLPGDLSVFSVSGNSFTGSLPSSWSRLEKMAELRLDDNPNITGKLPASWSAWGSNTGNSLQLSIVNTGLHGHMPRQWVQQFCLATVRLGVNHTLFQPVPLNLATLSDTSAEGPLIQLPAQHASINVSLNGKLYSFDYNTPSSICSIPHAARNVGLLWGIFAALLLATLVCVSFWQKRKQSSSTPGMFTRLSVIPTLLKHSKLQGVRRIADRVWFLASDVIWFVYSQVTDAVTIHQVFQSGQLHYAYILLAILLVPFAFMFLLVVRVSIKICKERIRCIPMFRRAAAFVIGVVLSPVFFFLFEFAMIFHGIGVPLPAWFQALGVDLHAAYRMQSLAETYLNALPQSIVQSKLYLVGNDPNGVHVYIDTTLFLFSITGSLLSVLKSTAVVMVEVIQYKCTVIAYCIKLMKFEAFEGYRGFTETVQVIRVHNDAAD